MPRRANLAISVVHGVAWALYLAPKNRWRRARMGDALTHQLVVLPETGACPGYVLNTYAPPMWKRRGRGHVVHDASTYLDGTGSWLGVTGYGHADRFGSADQVMGELIGHLSRRGCWTYQPIAREEIAGESARRIRFEVGALRVTEWRFERDGWIYGVGAVAPRAANEDEVLERARRSLATWQWLEPGST